MTRLIVAYSERLGPITDYERRLERDLDADLRRVPLWSPADVQEFAADADAVIVGAVEPMDAAALASMARCRILVRRGVGVDNVDIEAATRLGIPVAYVPDASVEEVSDHALALLLTLERKISTLHGAVKDGVWGRDTTALIGLRRGIRRFSTLTLGIVGFGRIGQALARKSRSIFGTLVVSDPFASEALAAAHGAALVSFDELLDQADLVSIHSALTPETRHLFGHETFARMKRGAYLVNTARGGLVDEQALVAALTRQHLAGAALDVNEQEPLPEDSALLALPSVLLTGHSAGHSETSSDELRERAVQAAVDALEGRVPAALANPQVLTSQTSRLTVRG
ncbi:MAG: C-terminal binding protein [Chloroflexi bacterium]|nr:C-terminal binding protein [Chloroflexota bacterium]